MKHVEQDWNFHEVQSSRNVVVSKHDEAFAQLQGGFLQEVSLPVTSEDLLEKLCVNLRWVLLDQLV